MGWHSMGAQREVNEFGESMVRTHTWAVPLDTSACRACLTHRGLWRIGEVCQFFLFFKKKNVGLGRLWRNNLQIANQKIKIKS
jgi:hypothetical protein